MNHTDNPAGVERSMYIVIPLGPNPIILGSLLRGLRYRDRRGRGTKAYMRKHKVKT